MGLTLTAAVLYLAVWGHSHLKVVGVFRDTVPSDLQTLACAFGNLLHLITILTYLKSDNNIVHPCQNAINIPHMPDIRQLCERLAMHGKRTGKHSKAQSGSKRSHLLSVDLSEASISCVGIS